MEIYNFIDEGIFWLACAAGGMLGYLAYDILREKRRQVRIWRYLNKEK